MATKYTFRENVLRIVAVIGLIAVLLLGAWGIIQLAFFIPTLFDGSGSSTKDSKESLTVSSPLGVATGSLFPVSWSHKNFSGQYGYAVSYSCANGVEVKAPLPTGALQAVPCDTPFNYIGSTTTMPLVATLAGSKAAPVTFTVSATKLSSGAVTSTGSVTVTINPAQKPTVTTPAKPTTKKPSTGTAPKYVPSGRTTNLYGYADLQARITSNIGTARAGQRIALQFVIENVGSNVAQSGWAFTASLPYNPVYTYQSAPQQALYPGDKIVYTLNFDAQVNQNGYGNGTNPCSGWSYPCTDGTPIYGGPGTCNSYGPCNVPGYLPNVYGYTYPSGGYGQQTASVQADAYNMIWEANEANNYAAVSYQVY